MAAVASFGISPSEFWSLHPQEIWWIIESKQPELFQEPQRTRLLRLLEQGFDG